MKRKGDPSLIYMIEARDRVGGRTHTELIHGLGDEDDSTGDVGGQWVGEIQHRVLGFIERFGLELKEQYYPPAETKNGTGNHQPLDYLVECVGYCNPPLEDEAIEEFQMFISTLDSLVEEIDPQSPWRHPRAEEFDNMSS